MISRWWSVIFIVLFALSGITSLCAQQKGQYVPGQFGLNAGIVPAPGFTYTNVVFNYSASQLNSASGTSFPGITGTYSFWADENVFMYVPNFKVFDAYYAPFAMVNWASGSVVADLPDLAGIRLNAGGAGLADTWVQPINFGWHFNRLDLQAGDGFVAPTGRFSPGATNNVGSGYWGNDLLVGATSYLTKNKGTSASFAFDWEVHTRKDGTNFTPGQAITIEWGLGQALPLTKKKNLLAQIGVVGYDQWQVSNNGGTIGNTAVPASTLPFYSAHSVGAQGNLIALAQGLVGFFKYYGEYAAEARVQGRTFVFGISWNYKVPKAPVP